MMGDCDTIRLILCALKKHKDEGRVVKNACMALATIVEADGKIVSYSFHEKDVICDFMKTFFFP